MLRREPILRVAFYASNGGREPVRDWLRELDRSDRQTIGLDSYREHGDPVPSGLRVLGSDFEVEVLVASPWAGSPG